MQLRFIIMRKCFLNPGRRLWLTAGSIVLLVGVTLRAEATAQTTIKSESQSITLGLVSEVDKAAIENHFRELVNYVARKLSPASTVNGKVVVASSQLDLVKLLQQRQVDFYLESVYPTYTINYVHGAGKTLLRRWKGGQAEYQSLIFAKRDSGIRRLDDLRGKTIVFEDPGSTSGFLSPKFLLQRNGLKLTELRPSDANSSAEVEQYFFAHSQNKLLDAVFSNQAAAGAFSDDDLANLSETNKSQITVLAQTDRLPRHLVSIRSDLPPAVISRLEAVLLAMHEDDEGRRILANTDQTAKFDRLPGGEEALRKRLLDSFFAPERR
ncbi:MAG TPA: phosphate/phosphite/phosphonate ABC transporter substrate-binding protein [Candidatus Binatus sp.]|nr:phosphate/phosphite/phosphonate ABC transporter substrate-binding protein [Candidatus Binatus sp.]